MAISNDCDIPKLDLSPWTNGDDARAREKTGKALAEILHSHGFVALVGHGMAPQLVRDSFAMLQRLFDLPLEEKMKAPHPKAPSPHRGYTPPGGEDASGMAAHEEGDILKKAALSKIVDYKETYDIGHEANSQENFWLPDDVLPGFRSLMIQLFNELNRVSMVALDALLAGSAFSSQETHAIKKAHSGHNNHVRLIHYPSVDIKDSGAAELNRMHAHRDWGSFTLDLQDAAGGLEFAVPGSDGFVPAVPKEGVIYMNMADMFHVYSNGHYPSAPHRVTAPPNIMELAKSGRGGTAPARYSIPFFINPDMAAPVEPQQSYVLSGADPIYKPTSFLEHATTMLAAVRTDAKVAV